MTIACAAFVFALLQTSTFAAPVAEVRTARADGAVFPAVTQTRRVQRKRAVRISSSRQALPAPDAWRAGHEPAEGGVFVAPADSAAPAAAVGIVVRVAPPRP